MTANELRKDLSEGVVLFVFIKKDGTTRSARGTTCPDLIPADNAPKGRRTPLQQAVYNRQTVVFYDINKKGWRSMRIDAIFSYTRQPLKLS